MNDSTTSKEGTLPINLGITVKEAIATPEKIAAMSLSHAEKTFRLPIYKPTGRTSAATMRNGMPERQPYSPETAIRQHARHERLKAFHVLSLRYESKQESATGNRITMFITGANCAVRITCAESEYIIPSRNE